MHRVWHIPELLVQIVSFLPAADIDQAFHISHHFRAILRATLPPHLRPLPDRSPKKSTRQQSLQEVRDKARAFGTQENSLPAQLMMTDTYFHWREAARYEVLRALRPCLHPVLGKYATRLIDGYEGLADGNLNVCLQTDVPYQQLYDLVHGKERQEGDSYLAVKPPAAVTVFCLRVLGWDSTFANVRFRYCRGTKRLSIRVEREGGVRMSDVFDELRGTLVDNWKDEILEQDVVLGWVVEDHIDARMTLESSWTDAKQ